MPAVVDTALDPPLQRSGRPDALALAAALVTVVAWASAFVGIRAAGADIAAGPLTLARLLSGCAVLGAIVLARRERLPPRADVPRLVLVGLLWFGAYNVLLNAAEQRIDAGTAAMLVNVGPVFIAVLAGLLLGEGFPRTLLAGCAVSLVGVVVIGAATTGVNVDAGWGAAMCVGAAAAYAGAVIAQKPLLERTSALQVTCLACLVGVLACLPFAPALADDVQQAPASSIAWAVYLGVVPTALGFTTWAYALRRTTAGRMGATTYLVPPIAIFMGWLLLGESPPALAFAGGALCLAGVVVSRRRGRQAPARTRARSRAPSARRSGGSAA
jgi:drug/metabolite transporter (DMT)-like permease